MTRITVAALLVAGLVPVLHAQEPFKWQGKLAAGKPSRSRTSMVTSTPPGVRKRCDGDGAKERTQEQSGRCGDPGGGARGRRHDLCGLPIPEEQAGERLHSGSHGHNDNDNNDTEVDFDVTVPKGVRFVGRSVNGSVNAESIAADAEDTR